MLVDVFHELLDFAQYERRYVVFDLEHFAIFDTLDRPFDHFSHENKNFSPHKIVNMNGENFSEWDWRRDFEKNLSNFR